MRNEKVIKIIVLSFMILSLFGAMFSLGFFTDFLPIRSAYKELYDQLQAFNRVVFNYSLSALLPLAIMFILDNHKSNEYTIYNKVIAFVSGIFALYQSFFVLTNIGALRDSYSVIDPSKVQILYPNYKASELAFTFGYIIYILLGISAALLIAVAIVNTKQKEIVKEG